MELLCKTCEYDNELRRLRAKVRSLTKEAEKKRKHRKMLGRLEEEARRIREEIGEVREVGEAKDVIMIVDNAEVIVVEDDEEVIVIDE